MQVAEQVVMGVYVHDRPFAVAATCRGLLTVCKRCVCFQVCGSSLVHTIANVLSPEAMAEDEQDGPDLETLQAQIDMSMAFTNSIVSGWMKSSKAKLPSYSRNDDKELEEYMRRPARCVYARLPQPRPQRRLTDSLALP